MKKSSQKTNLINIHADHVYNALDSWLRSVGVLKDDEMILSIRNLDPNSDGTVTILKDKEHGRNT